MKKFLLVVASLVVIALVVINGKWTHRKHQRDALIKEMVAEISSDELEVHNRLSSDEVKSILAQPFYFIGKGKQVAAFKSHDERYVIKCILHNKLKIGKLTTAFSGMKTKKSVRKEARQKRLKNSFFIASSRAPEETGVLYLHLTKTQELPMLTLVDERGHIWELDANNLEFVIQKRAELLKLVIIRLMHEGKVDEAKKKLTSVLELMSRLAKKGIRDTDGALIRNNNLGFLDDRAILIDTGKLVLTQHMKKDHFARDLKKVKSLRKWLERYYPELGSHFRDEQCRVIDSFGTAYAVGDFVPQTPKQRGEAPL